MPKSHRLSKNPESDRLDEDARRQQNWTRWGPYLSERQWGTVREDYSPGGESWGYFTHEQARSRAYRWGEDGLLGITDRECRLCFAIALWNGRDPVLKERMFGLTGPEGNHGEDVKECYFFLDATPTSSYLKALYKYPQWEFPYQHLRDENRRRGRSDPEYELLDTGIFDGNRYFDVLVEYAKAGPNDLLMQITVSNRGPEAAELHVLPSLWFRNTWSWGARYESTEKPTLFERPDGRVQCEHATLGRFFFESEPANDRSFPARPAGSGGQLLFTENETNVTKLFGGTNKSPYVKDAFNEYLVHRQKDAVNPEHRGTKCAVHLICHLAPGEERVLRFRLYDESSFSGTKSFGNWFNELFARRRDEADTFYAQLGQQKQRASAQAQTSHRSAKTASLDGAEAAMIRRQAYAGLLWSKQFYHYIVKDWLDGDRLQPAPPTARSKGRNSDWPHLHSRDVLSMPDTWEYPWFAAWDLAFHMIPMAEIHPEFAKAQLNLILREWYMHPNGQMPAYEWNFDDVNPPVHAWACWRVYKIAAPAGKRDRIWLARVFQKLMLNFTWWVNRKDPTGHHVFSGGFLGLDNIGAFDRSKPLPGGCVLEQADGTAWMAFYCGTMLSMALELADGDPAYEDIASKFFEHFIAIADAMNQAGESGLWDETDGFYYDQLRVDGEAMSVRMRSMVGIIPLFAVELINQRQMERLPGFAKRTQWFLENRSDLAPKISYLERSDGCGHFLLAIPSRTRLERVLGYVLAETEFLSAHGVRSLSQAYRDHPFVLKGAHEEWRVNYAPGESDTALFGGNSNWRGPIWLPLNYLLIESLERYHKFYGEDFKVECPVGSGLFRDLDEVAQELATRIRGLFMSDKHGQRRCFGLESRFADDPNWQNLLWFHEYFHGETGKGLGACHQTGWTALITRML